MRDLVDILKAFFFSSLFVSTEATTAETALIYQVLGIAEKVIKKRKEQLRATLLEWAEVQGVPDKRGKGHHTLRAGGHTIKREQRAASQPDAEQLKELLKAEGIAVLEAFDEVKLLQLNPSKLSHLVEIGQLDKAKVEKLRRVTHALKISLSKPATEALKRVTPTLTEG